MTGQGRASAVRRKRGSSRDDGGKVNRNFDNDAASADDEIATNTNTLPSTHSSRDFHARAAEAVDILRRNALSVVSEQTWRSEQLDAEKDDLPASSSSPSWRQYQKELQSAVDLVSHSLVERSEESRLVVLGMVAGEHVLLLGPPGTAKSALGRRLSSICGGQFFQRLLTRFTTPEEIFGPLSLRALENDEYGDVRLDSSQLHLTVFTDGLEEVSTSLAKAANAVTVTDDAAPLCAIYEHYAASHGRTVVDPIDCLLLQHIVWRLPEQRAVVRQWLWDNLTPGGDGSAADVLQFRFLLNGLRQSIEMAVRSTEGDVTGRGGARSTDAAAITALREEVS
eukprot:CAMPEP_0178600922 /NCGR_PEP_ID=MMETSP0697-20121206/34128_1 /TAXON_ID=265572 /ORGANISM="Extubocellulus spinifer, Strain CCMP396" /LENGTH=337 /DNA_ID=CAMNT_0020238977 /DNA_START=161 /DNA_END=1172 /DNA_ORIENTATION=+